MTLAQIEGLAQGISEHMNAQGSGYCEVPSNSRKDVTHRVYFNEKLYSVSCTCEAGMMRKDCGHRVAVDRHFDSRRDILGQDVVQYVEDELRHSCCTCGRETKQVICGVCLA